METNKRFIRWNPRIFIVIIIFILAFVYFISPKVTNKTLCPRTGYYNMPAEFKRSLSLISQRSEEITGATGDNDLPSGESGDFKKRGKIGYCLDIQYANLSNYSAEGIFYTDENSKPDRLNIYVDRDYKNNDDLLLALLLIHETTHALQYYDNLLGENNCYDKEIEAFMMQEAFFMSLKNEEKKSIVYRLQQNPYSNDAYFNLIQLIRFSEIAYAKCGSFVNNCAAIDIANQVASFVKNSPFYQKQCQAQQ